MNLRINPLMILLLPLFFGACTTKQTRPDFSTEPNIRVLLMEGAEVLQVDAINDAVIGNAVIGVGTAVVAEGIIHFTNVGGIVAAHHVGDGVLLARGTALRLVPAGYEGVYKISNAATGDTPRQNPEYTGILEVHAASDGTLRAINVLPVENYLRGVVPYEIGISAPLEAMKAQAVAARAEALSAIHERTYAGPGYDICADVNCQVYRGPGRSTENTDRAIRETRGMIITWDGMPLPAYYSSNAGGFTEDIVNVWPHRDRGISVWDGVYDGHPDDEPGDLREEENARAWIMSRPNVYVNSEKHPDIPAFTHGNFRWTVTTSAEDLTGFVAEVKDIGRVVAIETGQRGPSARLKEITFIGENGNLTVGPELTIRRTWSPALRSSAVVFEPNGPADRPDSFTIHGAGHGHGVGMCQTGAMGRAHAGQDFEEILRHYYVGADITRAYE
ncbi:MAG: SpoIID/LytB domain-containing protein [Candidatus Sumerlaeia bacterium]|nr:SpoIID/LytB domain-containing protein [Candidatus Sumerlaeia bacterium]